MCAKADILSQILSRTEQEEIEINSLAPYAMKSRDSRGRVYPEKEDPIRTVYRRDRDRIIHTNAFRRLEYKTQVFVNHEGDYYRTRLTHSMEVSQIGGSIARPLRLNEDLIEAVTLAHDIGHPPFGHAGEDALHAIMKDHGGFNHNRQGLRVVEELEHRYPDFQGINLTWEVRESMNKHRSVTEYAGTQAIIDPNLSPLLEAQVADIADEIAYDSHDLDDGLTSGILKEEELGKLALWREAKNVVRSKTKVIDPEVCKYQIIRTVIDRLVTDLIGATVERLSKFNIKRIDDVRNCKERIVNFSEDIQAKRKILRKLLWDYLYKHERVINMSKRAKRCINELFPVYLKRPERLSFSTRSRIIEKGEDPYRVICDYIAGMTDRYCLQEHSRFCEPMDRI